MLRRKESGLVLLLLLACVVFFLAGAAFFALRPRPVKFTQPECKSNLKALYTTEKAYYQEKDKYSPFVGEIGFSPERGNRYAYFLDAAGPLEDRAGPATLTRLRNRGIGVDTYKHGPAAEVVGARLPLPLAGNTRPGVSGHCPQCEFVAACAANIDADPVVDVWSIASFDRIAADGTPIPSGQPWLEVDDRSL